jgi:hypothetical protein
MSLMGDSKKGSNRRRLRIFLVLTLVIGLTLGVGGGILWYHRVNNTITDEDLSYIALYTTNVPAASPDSDFENELRFIQGVQDAVLSVAPENSGLARGAEREPKDLYIARKGLCFDRSRVIEKILQSHGFRTRHIFLYSIKERSALRAFFTPGVLSHAITEVETERGWLVVDSNDRWISLDRSGSPRGMLDIQNAVQGESVIEWESQPPPIYSDIAPTVFVYGLYSRHGEFYPPYNFIPDINYGELVENF